MRPPLHRLRRSASPRRTLSPGPLRAARRITRSAGRVPHGGERVDRAAQREPAVALEHLPGDPVHAVERDDRAGHVVGLAQTAEGRPVRHAGQPRGAFDRRRPALTEHRGAGDSWSDAVHPQPEGAPLRRRHLDQHGQRRLRGAVQAHAGVDQPGAHARHGDEGTGNVPILHGLDPGPHAQPGASGVHPHDPVEVVGRGVEQRPEVTDPRRHRDPRRHTPVQGGDPDRLVDPVRFGHVARDVALPVDVPHHGRDARRPVPGHQRGPDARSAADHQRERPALFGHGAPFETRRRGPFDAVTERPDRTRPGVGRPERWTRHVVKCRRPSNSEQRGPTPPGATVA